MLAEVDEDGAGTPGGVALELLEQLPLAVGVFDGAGERDENGVGGQVVAEALYFVHHFPRVAGAAHKDHSAIAPVHLSHPQPTFSKF